MDAEAQHSVNSNVNPGVRGPPRASYFPSQLEGCSGLNGRGRSCSSGRGGGIRENLEVCLVITTAGWEGVGAAGTQRGGTGDAAEHPAVHRMPPASTPREERCGPQEWRAA